MKPTFLLPILLLVCGIASAQKKTLPPKVITVKRNIVVQKDVARPLFDLSYTITYVYRTKGKRVHRALFFETKRNRKLA